MPQDPTEERLAGPGLYSLACREAYSDGRVEEDEAELLRKLERFLGIPAELAQRLRDQARDDAGLPSRPPGPLDPSRLFRKACRLAWADGRVEERERNLLRLFAKLLGVEGDEARRIFETTRSEAQAPQVDPLSDPFPADR